MPDLGFCYYSKPSTTVLPHPWFVNKLGESVVAKLRAMLNFQVITQRGLCEQLPRQKWKGNDKKYCSLLHEYLHAPHTDHLMLFGLPKQWKDLFVLADLGYMFCFSFTSWFKEKYISPPDSKKRVLLPAIFCSPWIRQSRTF